MSPGFVAAATLVVAWCLAVLGPPTLGGFASGDVSVALVLAAAALALTGWAADRSRDGWRAAIGAVFVWSILVAGLGGAWFHRAELIEVGRVATEELNIGAPRAVIGQGGEVTVRRRPDGTFAVPALVNGSDVRFLFDTGATAVVLSSETAAALGLSPDTLRFRVPVTTANGRGTAAPVILDRLAVGSIVMTRVPALVVRPGMLDGNLLGHTFLEKLESYEVRGDRLVLRAAKTI
jgi:aspartyl protease family protein